MLLSDMETLMGIVSDGIPNLAYAPAGPPNVGRASQMIAGGIFGSSGNPGLGQVQFARNTGFTFYSGYLVGANATFIPVGPETANIISADFNKDGNQDFAVVYLGNSFATPPANGGVAIVLGKSDGTFSTPVSYSAGIAPISVATLDVNKDGILDLAVADNSSSSVYVLLGKGDGTFNTAAAYPAGQGNQSIVIADFNNDGNPDLGVTADDQTATILLGNGNGTFRAGSKFTTGKLPAYIATADFNKDGKLDLAITAARDNTVTIYLGAGDGTFQVKSSYITSYGPDPIVVTDYNGDGILDVLLGMGDARLIAASPDSYNIDILLGRGDGTFQGASSQSVGSFAVIGSLAVGDFNQDGKTDFAATDLYGGKLYWALGGSNSGFQQPTTISTNLGQLFGVAVADFNGDGKADIAATAESNAGSVAIFLSSGNGFSPPTTFPSGGDKPNAIVAADFTGDGKPDLAVVNQNSGTTVIFRNTGGGSFQVANTYSTGGHPGALTAADVNGDGKLDLVVADQGDPGTMKAGAVYVLLGNGSGGFQVSAPITASVYPVSPTVADINGDGKADLIVSTYDGNFHWQIATYLGNGTGAFGNPTLTATDFGVTTVGAADFDGDGRVDLVAAHCCGATDMTYLAGNGDGTFKTEVHFTGPASPVDLRLADLNGDGVPDLVIAGQQGGVAGILDSLGSFINENGASFDPLKPIAQDSIVTAKGSHLATTTLYIGENLPYTLGGTKVDVTDSKGMTRPAQLIYVSLGQVNYILPPGTATGTATVKITAGDGIVTSGTVAVVSASPGVIAISPAGLTAANLIRVTNGMQAYEVVYQVANNAVAPLPIDLGPASDQLYLSIYGTGFRYAKSVTIQIGGITMPNVSWAGSGQYPGLDQANLGPVPRGLLGKGSVNVVLTADGVAANTTNLTFK
jgi:uncharacterized protein (TIGR03437 family)